MSPLLRGPAAYDLAMAPLERLGLARLRRRLAGGVTGDVLEVGVGTGAQLAHYSPAARVTAIDPDPAGLARAARRRPGADLRVATAEALPFPDEAFDWVVVALALCSVADPAAAVAEARRVLRPGGRLRAVEHVRSPHAAIARAQGAVGPAWRRIAPCCHLDRPTVETVRASELRITHMETRLGGHVVLLEAVRDAG